jgi:hypothetical protein
MVIMILFTITFVSVSIWIFYERVAFVNLGSQSMGVITLATLMLIKHMTREMSKRIEFNRHVMLSVEGKRNKEIAAKLMPV